MTQVVKEGWNTFKSIFTGMGITFRHFFQPSVTEMYPEEKPELPAGARARLFVNIEDCIGCNLCARSCPVNCIDIETVAATADVDLGQTSTGNPKRFWLPKFDIDMAKCMYCNLCVYPCPTNCIYMEPEYEYSEYDRDNLLYHFTNLSPEKAEEVRVKAEQEAEEKKRKREEMQRQKALEKEKANKEKMSASGDATNAKTDPSSEENTSESETKAQSEDS